jgi:hypothetical protein
MAILRMRERISRGRKCNTLTPVNLTWDERKAATTWKKHGVSFEEAAKVFGDALAIISARRATAHDEETIGRRPVSQGSRPRPPCERSRRSISVPPRSGAIHTPLASPPRGSSTSAGADQGRVRKPGPPCPGRSGFRRRSGSSWRCGPSRRGSRSTRRSAQRSSTGRGGCRSCVPRRGASAILAPFLGRKRAERAGRRRSREEGGGESTERRCWECSAQSPTWRSPQTRFKSLFPLHYSPDNSPSCRGIFLAYRPSQTPVLRGCRRGAAGVSSRPSQGLATFQFTSGDGAARFVSETPGGLVCRTPPNFSSPGCFPP